jgi:steroid delta-isomerase-like uncharacterized protein
MSEENKALARRNIEEVFNEGNLATIDELIDPDWVNHDPTNPEGFRGIEGAKQFVEVYRSAFPDVHITIEEQVAEGDMVATRWTARGTHQGELSGIPASGNQVTVRGMSMDRISGGKIVETWDNYDALGMMQQIGAIPEAGPPGS